MTLGNASEMEATVQVALISAAASLIVAALAHVWTRYMQRMDQLRERKLEHYRELLFAISDLADQSQDQEAARRRFAAAANTIVLVAPPEVVKAVMDFHDETCASNRARTQEKHDRLLKALVLRLRSSLELPFKDDDASFEFHLIGTHITAVEESRPTQAVERTDTALPRGPAAHR